MTGPAGCAVCPSHAKHDGSDIHLPRRIAPNPLRLVPRPAFLPRPQHRSSVDYSFLEAFCRDVVMQQYSPAQKHAVMAAFVDAFAGGAMPNDQLEKILQVGRLNRAGTKQARARG